MGTTALLIGEAVFLSRLPFKQAHYAANNFYPWCW